MRAQYPMAEMKNINNQVESRAARFARHSGIADTLTQCGMFESLPGSIDNGDQIPSPSGGPGEGV